MFDITEADVEIMLQHYGWVGVGDFTQEDHPKWGDDAGTNVEEKWHNDYSSSLSGDNGIQCVPDREISLQ